MSFDDLVGCLRTTKASEIGISLGAGVPKLLHIASDISC